MFSVSPANFFYARLALLRVSFFLLFLFLAGCGGAREGLPAKGVSLAWYEEGLLAPVLGRFPEAERLRLKDPEHFAELRQRGEYLVEHVAACGSCHSAVPGDPKAPLSGGQLMSDRFGSLRAANITPDEETGIGRWDLASLKRAIRAGIDHLGKPLTIDLHQQYRWMSDRDTKAISVYLFSSSPQKNQIERRELGPFERKKWGLVSQHSEVAGYVPAMPESSGPRHGKYISTFVAGCKSCHTPNNGLVSDARPFSGGGRAKRGLLGTLVGLFQLLVPEKKPAEDTSDYDFLLSRQQAERGDQQASAFAPPVVEDEKSKIIGEALEEGSFPLLGPNIRGGEGLAAWSEEDIVGFLRGGKSPSGEQADARLCPWPYYSGMKQDDALAIARYLKSLSG